MSRFTLSAMYRPVIGYRFSRWACLKAFFTGGLDGSVSVWQKGHITFEAPEDLVKKIAEEARVVDGSLPDLHGACLEIGGAATPYIPTSTGGAEALIESTRTNLLRLSR